ncbi:hypothetical protein PC118_g15012 [Phytophthora cactorum]|uniref:Uncharacterized protein n=1 Tax=Phytophthora cactorum TaxID=29920 RepID=A0A8T0YUV3_9STRA|nr:hypothetical protein PC112_g15004 [Phytophthora cactorum]KAG2852253.1 hypothetical protein PC113_g15182 [Phytophthora cactorum]KAG2922921.1 hypothetical protein PC117_g15863 [Phytophthora cactorum]KAG2973628.1 hypothetical protein PC118_g15012 [Phytophthora cactorum]KAG3003459.1 hypothetical protein PC119_g15983 [Phytophthora cactorum]
MTTIESEAKRSGLWQAQQSVEDAVNVFASCASSIAVPRDTAKHRKRRQGQLRDNRSDSASGITRRTARKEFLARSRRAGSDGSHERLTHAHRRRRRGRVGDGYTKRKTSAERRKSWKEAGERNKTSYAKT